LIYKSVYNSICKFYVIHLVCNTNFYIIIIIINIIIIIINVIVLIIKILLLMLIILLHYIRILKSIC